jgi:hypothetical protein
MTDEEFSPEGGEEAIEDLEAPAAAQADVAGGIGPCRPTNQCQPVNTLVHHCRLPTQLCTPPTCNLTMVQLA